MRNIPLKLYNTESRKQEEIVPLDGRTLRIYTCGPTVYNYAHIGNFRTYVFEDLLRRTLKFFGYQVKQVMNITDVDDKTIKGAIRENITLDAYTQPFTDAFFEDLNALNVEPVEYYPRATDYIPEMIAIIEKLLEKGVAYRGQDESIYFAISKFPSYGRLSHLHLHELKCGASNRVASDEYDKESASDFVLWKAYDKTRDGNIFWESPFGKGRPGWHIECSAMAMKILGESLDIHVGGVDNMFPHHENEIAQSEAFSCRHFVKHWLHAEHLLVDHKKMSKSLGNVYTLRDLLKRGYTGPQVRYMLLHTHYRSQLNFTLDGLDSIGSTMQRLSDFIFRLRAICHEKRGKALDIILEKALPTNSKKDLHDRILHDVQANKDQDILDPDFLSPILNRALATHPEKHGVLNSILSQVKEEKQRKLLAPILEKNLSGVSQMNALVKTIFHKVSDEKDRDILDPSFMKPILEKALGDIGSSQKVVDMILHDLQVKKNHGFVLPILEKTLSTFINHLSDDLNISPALASLFDMVREVNVLCDNAKIGISEAEDVLEFLSKVDQVLGVLPLHPQEETPPSDLEEALRKRESARKEKNWKIADECRDLIQSRGYFIEDTPQGARLKRSPKA